MFQAPPREGPLVTWLLLGTWVSAIFGAIPLARRFVRAVDVRWGAENLRWLAITIIVFASLVAVWNVYHRLKRLPWDRLLWLGGLMGVFIYLSLEKMKQPSEALHFVEYGLLGLLAFRAVSHHIPDRLAYGCAISICLLIGTADEIIQWFTPGRYWDVRDIFHNGIAATLAQVALAGGLRPAFIRPGISPRSVRWFCLLNSLWLLQLGFCASNTPVADARVSDAFPALSFLRNPDEPMSEYGFRIDDPAIGRFYSRFAPEDLLALDKQRAGDSGPVIAHYTTEDTYSNFLHRYTPATDAFTHEAMVHIYRRNYHAAALARFTNDPVAFSQRATIAYRENQILVGYFPATLERSGQAWPPGRAEELEPFVRKDRLYKSEVSRHLITAVSEKQVWTIIFALLAFYACLTLWKGRGSSYPPGAAG